ncbi:uncharacterized protein LOC118197160 [Stegodyphus dumicola]|uniref:uncharacterized protein LOC118197160 n=1 Tax=Stegodyphus dumicola TaxID=202533 RepID=UPI0015A97FBF|nr:uncharacterized protein LOC118197160 [Stegodyphus dumicola]
MNSMLRRNFTEARNETEMKLLVYLILIITTVSGSITYPHLFYGGYSYGFPSYEAQKHFNKAKYEARKAHDLAKLRAGIYGLGGGLYGYRYGSPFSKPILPLSLELSIPHISSFPSIYGHKYFPNFHLGLSHTIGKYPLMYFHSLPLESSKHLHSQNFEYGKHYTYTHSSFGYPSLLIYSSGISSSYFFPSTTFKGKSSHGHIEATLPIKYHSLKQPIFLKEPAVFGITHSTFHFPKDDIIYGIRYKNFVKSPVTNKVSKSAVYTHGIPGEGFVLYKSDDSHKPHMDSTFIKNIHAGDIHHSLPILDSRTVEYKDLGHASPGIIIGEIHADDLDLLAFGSGIKQTEKLI